ncbi:hypothetical protein KUTeg_007479 [Tegillarca granosa]|uniref:Uncharacterized protein n=1 Tax=Tegillarca granosa TaxID=220873 RepID=A0ABQ9FDE5_TEGGR|nr:hypothetical protein KUTeg_007479 [Tegillarca granosa]
MISKYHFKYQCCFRVNCSSVIRELVDLSVEIRCFVAENYKRISNKYRSVMVKCIQNTNKEI